MDTKLRYIILINLFFYFKFIKTPDFWLEKGCPWEIERIDV